MPVRKSASETKSVPPLPSGAGTRSKTLPWRTNWLVAPALKTWRISSAHAGSPRPTASAIPSSWSRDYPRRPEVVRGGDDRRYHRTPPRPVPATPPGGDALGRQNGLGVAGDFVPPGHVAGRSGTSLIFLALAHARARRGRALLLGFFLRRARQRGQRPVSKSVTDMSEKISACWSRKREVSPRVRETASSRAERASGEPADRALLAHEAHLLLDPLELGVHHREVVGGGLQVGEALLLDLEGGLERAGERRPRGRRPPRAAPSGSRGRPRAAGGRRARACR